MFQNITQETEKNEYSENRIIKERILLVIKEIFKYQNILIYLLTFLMSTVSIRNEIMPFGLAMVAACLGGAVPIIMVFILTGIGTLISGGINAFGNFIAVAVIYLILNLIFKPKVAIEERNEVYKTGSRLFWSYLIVEFIKNVSGIFLMYDLFISVISASLLYVFYKIFVNGLVVLKEFKIKKAFTIEEIISATIIIAIASMFFSKLNISSLSLSNIVIIFMIMVLGWKNGMLLGAVSGISSGLVLSLMIDSNLTHIYIFAISGIFAGFLNRFGKLGVIIGFVLGNCLLIYMTNGNSDTIIYFREIFIASIGLLLVPNKIKIELEDLIGRNKLLSNIGETRLNENKEIAEKLKAVSNTIFEMTNSKEKEPEELKETFIQDFLDNIEDYNQNIFYEEISKEENGIVEDIYHTIEKKEIIVDNDLIEIFNKHNSYILIKDEVIKNDLQEIIKIANRTYKIVQINIVKEREKQKQLSSMSKGLKSVSKIIDKCADSIDVEQSNIFEKKEKEILILLKNKNIPIISSKIKQSKNGKYIIELKLDYDDNKLRDKEVVVNISDILSKTISSKMSFQRDKKDVENKEYYQVYSSEDKYIVQVGSSKIAKEGSNISGDSNLQMRLEDGKYIFAISDGMGTGEEAKDNSKTTIRMIKNLISSGFEKEESINLINSTLNINSDSEMYSSLDISILDLYKGQAEIIKSGACNTYIKNKKNVNILQSNNTPVGILDNTELEVQTIDVSDGDIILMCSDGILESKDDTKKDWIEEFLKNVSTNNVQKISDLILAEAVDNNYGIAGDDMSVIVCKVLKKK